METEKTLKRRRSLAAERQVKVERCHETSLHLVGRREKKTTLDLLLKSGPQRELAQKVAGEGELSAACTNIMASEGGEQDLSTALFTDFVFAPTPNTSSLLFSFTLLGTLSALEMVFPWRHSCSGLLPPIVLMLR